ncbi:glutamic acid-rich protein-like [Leptopilina boulardi]|uniref:glutamic acid-rich protein-like n=1 Tax=Leptopilina boulardi TaxID=63433 RepID=UPI0021F5E33F|nr:glutamic acid-rich protein-like [Leptopilina boulardi]
MEENENEPTNEGFDTPKEDEVEKNQESNEDFINSEEGDGIKNQADEIEEKNSKLKNRNITKKKKNVDNDDDNDEDCCTTKKRMKLEKEKKWRTMNIFEKECKPPKSNPVPRHCITKKEHLDILATPKQICPPPCLQKTVVRKLAPVSPRILQLAKPTRHHILRTIQDCSNTLPPLLLHNLITMLETESSLSPEQTSKLLRDKKCRPKRKRKKSRRHAKCKKNEIEKQMINNNNQPQYDPVAVCCQYQMAEKFVKSILDWQSPMAKEEYQDIGEIILRRLSRILDYTPTNGNGDRRSQQMHFLADIISSWILGVNSEVAEAHRESEEERARRQREEDEEETDDEDNIRDDGLYKDDDSDDDDDDNDDGDDKGDKGEKGKGKEDEEEKVKDEDDGEDKKSDRQKSESTVYEDAQMELEDKGVQKVPEVEETESQIQPEVAEKETEVDAQLAEEDETKAVNEIIDEPTEDTKELDDEDAKEADEDKTIEADEAAKAEDDKGKETEEQNAEEEEEDEAKPKADKEDTETDKEDEKPETDGKYDSLKLFQTDLPFINFMQIFSTIYKTMEADEENMGQDPIVNRIHRAIYEKCYNAVMLDDSELMTNNAKDLIDVMTGKIAIWLSKILTESQVNLMNKYPAQVESFEVRDWSKWLNHTSKTAKNWSVWLQSLIKEIQKMQDGQVSRGEWSDWTKQVDTDAALWRRFYLDAMHQAHHNVMMMGGREIVKSGEKHYPELEKEIRTVDL